MIIKVPVLFFIYFSIIQYNISVPPVEKPTLYTRPTAIPTKTEQYKLDNNIDISKETTSVILEVISINIGSKKDDATELYILSLLQNINTIINNTIENTDTTIEGSQEKNL